MKTPRIHYARYQDKGITSCGLNIMTMIPSTRKNITQNEMQVTCFVCLRSMFNAKDTKKTPRLISELKRISGTFARGKNLHDANVIQAAARRIRALERYMAAKGIETGQLDMFNEQGDSTQ